MRIPRRPPRSVRTVIRMLGAASLTLATVSGLAMVGSPAQAATILAGAELRITADGLGTIDAGKDLSANVTLSNVALSNVSSLTPPSGNIVVTVSDQPLNSRAALQQWLHPADGSADTPSQRTLLTVATGTLSSGISNFPITIPAAALKLPAAGVYGLAAELQTGSTVIGRGQTSIVAPAGSPIGNTESDSPPVAARPVDLAIALPITAPPGSEGVISAQSLKEYTALDGPLTKKLDAAVRRPVAIAVDPMILASIRILGSSAPLSAQNWLARLQEAPNQIFALSYADSDIAVQAQAGIPLMQPTSLRYAVNDSLFSPASTPPTSPASPASPVPSTPADSRPADSNTPSVTPIEPLPEPSDGLPKAPTLQSLTDWNYTATGIGWPADATVTGKDLAAFEQDGIDTTILSGSNVVRSDQAGADQPSTDQTTPTAHATIGGHQVLVADSEVTDALRAAVAAGTDREWSRAMAELSAQLALISEDGTTGRRTLVATLARDVRDLGRFGETMDAVGTLSWASPATLSQALTTPATHAYVMKDSPESADRIAEVKELHSRASHIAELATVVEHPELITGRYRADVLALLAVSWLAEPGWKTQVQEHLAASSQMLDAVRLSPMSDVQMIGGQASIPVTVINDLSLAATVRVQTIPLNGRLTVDKDVTAVIEAGSQAKVLVPVTARVANGEVTLRVSLYNDDMSIALDGPDFVSVQVRADWETFGTLILAVLVVGFFGFGLWRNIMRRRKKTEPDAHTDRQQALDD